MEGVIFFPVVHVNNVVSLCVHESIIITLVTIHCMIMILVVHYSPPPNEAKTTSVCTLHPVSEASLSD